MVRAVNESKGDALPIVFSRITSIFGSSTTTKVACIAVVVLGAVSIYANVFFDPMSILEIADQAAEGLVAVGNFPGG